MGLLLFRLSHEQLDSFCRQGFQMQGRQSFQRKGNKAQGTVRLAVPVCASKKPALHHPTLLLRYNQASLRCSTNSYLHLLPLASRRPPSAGLLLNSPLKRKIFRCAFHHTGTQQPLTLLFSGGASDGERTHLGALGKIKFQ